MNSPRTSCSHPLPSSSSSSNSHLLPLSFPMNTALAPLTQPTALAHPPSLAMAEMGNPLDAAARRATRRSKLDAKKRSRNANRQQAAGASGSSGPRYVNSLNSNRVRVLDPDLIINGLRYLLKKELKNSDIGYLGRIVLPKRDSEEYLPLLKMKESIAMIMDDYTDYQTWTFKYRYWPNNKSRMYILENTGDYIKHHGLRTGDFIVIYKDDINDRYVIRAKKASSSGDGPPAAAAAAAVATATTTAVAAAEPVTRDEGIFDFILPDDTASYPDLLKQLPDDNLLNLDYDFDQGYDFMQDFPPAPFPDDNTGNNGSSSFIDPMNPFFGFKP